MTVEDITSKNKRISETKRQTNVGVGRTEVKHVEMREKILNAIKHSKQSASLNHKDSTLKGGISSLNLF